MYLAQELADIEGDTERVSVIAKQLEDLEERAVELDRQRSKGLSAIRSESVSAINWFSD